MVVIEARHLCVEMRGVKKPGALTVTSGDPRDLLQPAQSARSSWTSLETPCVMALPSPLGEWTK
mgnify:CR=1 FL=1